MNLVSTVLILLYGIYVSDAGYGANPGPAATDTQSDVEAPPYVPSYLKNQKYTKTGYSGTKSRYSGTKTGYSGTKTGYSGTKTYSGTKSGNPATKTGYGESQTWHSKTGYGPTYDEFHNQANEAYTAMCSPECKNGGICVDTNTCRCAANYQGLHCEFEKKPCLSPPPLPMNSRRRCSAELCTVTCVEGHKFIDGTTTTNMRCMDGRWQPTRADFTTIPDCEPECNPPCANGGICLAVNVCQCPTDYRGPQCQYATSVCDVRKLAFNGGYNCFGNAESFSCKLSCPAGATFSSPAAELYTCAYAEGVYLPQPIPHCVFNEVVVITPSNSHHNNSSYYEYHTWSNSSQSHYSEMDQESGFEQHSGYNQHTGDFDNMTQYVVEGGGFEQKATHVIVQDFTPKGGVCLAWAGVHYKTFDGKIYSFESPCQHILIRDAKEHTYTVGLKHGACKRAAYCPSELSVYLEDKLYALSVAEDGSVVFRSTRRLIPIPASLPGIRVAMPSDYVIVNLDAAGVALKWDTNNVIIVEGSVLLWNNTEGLCGTLDGNPENDFTTKEGTIAQTNTALASSWQLNKIGDVCDSNPTATTACASETDEALKRAQQFCARVFSKEKFRKCSKVMDISQLLETCQWDYCACTTSLSPEECACSTVSVYAKECLRHGVEEMKNWRDADTCPMQCPEGKLYCPCGPDTQPSCAYAQLSASTDNSTCVEGCFCPEGLLLEGGRCVPKDQCPCRLRNKSFPPGAVVPKDCNTCTCQAGEWTCTQVACGARCSAIGDPHYTTFDGLRYDFMGHCTYNLLSTDNVTVEVENVACSGSISEAMNLVPYNGVGKPSCTKAVTLKYGAVSVHLKQGGYILVNGQEVSSLPVLVGDVKIRAASSLFLIVQLPNKVDLWWDGNTRIFVDVPAEFHEKTKGLCGTFNLNQKDDFLTPEGDVEQSAHAFANKWKTRELCDDVSAEEPEHPCRVNVENKEAAEKYCGKLKSKLFEECHWHVDVTPYYEACVYDMCACAGDAARCLCPVLGDYAMACAQGGAVVQWRLNVKECELSCNGGQEYTVCADSCMRTCTDVAVSGTGTCKPCCVEGCACPPGQVLDGNNVCVPIGKCPCFHKGLQFDAGYKEVRAGRRERELCTCVGARWDCVPATDNDIQNYPPAEDLRSNCTAANHMEFTTCIVAEPLTCKNMHLPSSTTTAECRPGCQCKKGYVLDSSSKSCVLATQCPCHHGGTSYPDGHTMQEECNTCECKSGNWTCTTLQCSGTCTAWGDSHLITFDGAEYDFEGVCTYLLAKGAADGSDGFHVEIQNVPCGSTGATCSKSVTLKVGGAGDEEVAALTKEAPLPDLSNLKRIKLRIAGAFVFLDVPSLGMSVQWDRGLRTYVRVDPMWHGRVKGLCGNYNSDMRDDFQTPTGGIAESSALIFADSWKLKTTCPKPRHVTDHCNQRPERREWATAVCGALKRHPFSLCHSEVPPSGFESRCARDACACDSGADCACACAALAAYARACAARGVTFKWRTQENCPMQCDEECSNYNECVSPCPPETCDNTLHYAEVSAICRHDTCIEGCKPKESCPEGSVYTNDTFKECVPRAACRPVCLTLADGRQILEGEVMEEDACHTCRCSRKHKVCTGQPCSTEPEGRSLIKPTTKTPNDAQLSCVTGWTQWVNSGPPETGPHGESVDHEPVPRLNQLPIGSPMCEPDKMTQIECRTTVHHKSAKETGLDAVCGLPEGLLCKETGHTCPDFEIRVYCQCDEEFQCLNSAHPNYPHPTDCSQFYECTPDAMSPDKPHAVLKACAGGLMYNPVLMVCDWPASVLAVRPECGTTTEAPKSTRYTEPPSTAPAPTTQLPTTPDLCPPGQVHSDCAYPCDQLCDHFYETLQNQSHCIYGQKCVEGCVDKSVMCEAGSRWRDERTCVPLKDCTCYNEGNIVKPGGVVINGCEKCQCLDNQLHCDWSDCSGPTHLPMIVSPEALYTPTTTPTVPTTPTTVVTPLIVKNTATPPPECSPDAYTPLLWSRAEPLPAAAFSASSASSAYYSPHHAVLDGRTLDDTAGSWNPASQDTDQYIQVTFPRREPVYGVVLQGSPIYDQYVTSYELMYGDDGHVFDTVDGPDGKPRVFRGPLDHKESKMQLIEPPIEAKVVRIRPLTWHEEIAVRFELIGCQEPSTTPATVATALPLLCEDLLGLGAELPIESIEVSSNNDLRQFFKLDSERGWKPVYSTPGEWIMFDFTSPRNITGIKSKGGANGWVTAYNVMYTSDLSTFNPVIDDTGSYTVFQANYDKDTEVVNKFRLPIHARYLKVLPLKWKYNIEMRLEPIGCFEPYPVTQATPSEATPQSAAATCELCPGVPAATCACASSDAPYYDGENCVTRDQCPCVESYMSYAVGSSFRGSSCDECVCKLGGVTDCRAAVDCVCAPTLVPKLSSSCECLCEPCPNGTKICPTSKMCLKLEQWCDGVQDCPDDEFGECGATTSRPPVVTTIEPVVVTTYAPTVAVTQSTVAEVTTAKPIECPKVECPPGYFVRYSSAAYASRSTTSDLPPPRPRVSYARYYKGSKGGYTKGGYSKGGYSKGGSAPQPTSSPAFNLEKPVNTTSQATSKEECAQFKCVPNLPPPYKPGSTPAPLVCSAPACPPQYSLKLEVATPGECPQYVCVPPPERLAFCNVTGRTFNTFDGAEYKYDVCFHILARENRFDSWTVLVRKKCRLEGCVNELLIHQDDQLILIKPNLIIEYDNYEYTVEQTSKICFQKNSFDVYRMGSGLAVKSRKYNFTVLYSSDGDIKIGVFKNQMGSVDGLCGAFDGDAANDRRLPDGSLATSIDEFGRAWAKPGLAPNACHTKLIPPEHQKRVWELCEVITKEPISKCGKVLNLDKWRSICLEKICECEDLLVNGTKRTGEECRCLLLEQLVAECLAADKDMDLSDWRMQRDCPAECPTPLVHYDCFRKSCEPSCSAIGSASRLCPVVDGMCSPGCYCPEGKLRKGEQCVAPAECLDCTCTGVGAPAKYVTFEGDDLPFLGNCTYLASRDHNDTGHHVYEVYATSGACEDNAGSGTVCTTAVHLIHAGRVFRVTKDSSSKKLVITLDGEPIYKFPLKKDWVLVSSPSGQDVSVELTAAHVELTVLLSKLEFSVRVPSHLYAAQTEGLCGVCAGFESQLVTSNGTVTDDFELYGKSWQAPPSVLEVLNVPLQEQCGEVPPPPECRPPPPEHNPCYNLLNADRFGACHALIEPQSYVESCEEELCALNSTDVCAILERYAAACRRQQVCLDWRAGLCPYQCEEPWVYRTCVDCERSCDNVDEKCDKQPVEGCFCPEGQVRVNNTCIEPSKCFPCDANKEHYAGDEWQEDACTKCTCSKLPNEHTAHVACTTHTCAAPVCAERERLLTTARVGACCPEHVCVPKPEENVMCEEPKKMECGFGQVLKQKTTPRGCKEFACECKPASECEHIPSASEVDILEPGMERVMDDSGCCPRVHLHCRPEHCPDPPHCPLYHTLRHTNATGKCCPQYKCEEPVDKCIVTLEWEAASKGGEKARTSPQVLLKDLDSAWLDGPCRSCRCEQAGARAAPRCSVSECSPIVSTEQFVLEPRAVPFACCPAPAHVACRDGDDIYRVGENWTSAYDVCETYQCLETADGNLERVTTVQACHSDCDQGWKYFPAEKGSGKCCGRCKPVACVCEGVERAVGERWASLDHCVRYTCVDENGTLQIQSSNETCEEVPDAIRKQFVLQEHKAEGQCCASHEPLACRVGSDIYQEGQSWPTADPCKNVTCARDATGRLSQQETVQTCARECRRGWAYREARAGRCCGECVRRACELADQLQEPGTTWYSADNCTAYSCDALGDDVSVTSTRRACPDVSRCAPEDLLNETCCQVCNEKPSALSTCVPESLPSSETIGLIRVPLGAHGLCVNKRPMEHFKECRGTCGSGTLYNNQTGSHDSKCECCQAAKYEPLTVTLDCEDGTQQPHRVASPARCACASCGSALPSGTKNPSRTTEPDYDIPEIYHRFGSSRRP